MKYTVVGQNSIAAVESTPIVLVVEHADGRRAAGQGVERERP